MITNDVGEQESDGGSLYIAFIINVSFLRLPRSFVLDTCTADSSIDKWTPGPSPDAAAGAATMFPLFL